MADFTQQCAQRLLAPPFFSDVDGSRDDAACVAVLAIRVDPDFEPALTVLLGDTNLKRRRRSFCERDLLCGDCPLSFGAREEIGIGEAGQILASPRGRDVASPQDVEEFKS